ncbi:MAG: AAA family ATPase, partial [Bacteroidales bacterium]|nr:AAA family ATPase [Bacteroidales bacterium]
MKRKLLEQLVEWKNSKKRLPLLLEGARQVGKTYLLKKLFGEQYFEKVVHVNF